MIATNDDDNCFCRMVDQQKVFMPYSQPESLPEILTITNLWHAMSRVWTCTESEFRLCWMKLWSSDNRRLRLQKCKCKFLDEEFVSNMVKAEEKNNIS